MSCEIRVSPKGEMTMRLQRASERREEEGGTGTCRGSSWAMMTDVGGKAAVLGDSLRHRLVPPRDSRTLATAWHSVLCDPDRRKADGIAA